MKFKHSKSVREVGRLKRIMAHFCKHVCAYAEKKAKRDPKWRVWQDEPTVENLLALRKSLVAMVKKGMLDRKDLEEEIAVLAGLIWFMRQEEDRRYRIENF